MSVEQILTKYNNGLTDEERKIHRETFLHFVKQLGAGSETVSTKCRDGRTFDAVFHTATPFAGKDFRVCLKAARAKNEEGRVVADPSIETGSTLILGGRDWNSVKVKKVNLKSDAAELMTDGSIRGRDLTHLIDRDLKGVEKSWLDPATHSTLEGNSGAGNWDQFAANAKLAGYNGSKFDENIYTTRLDKSTISRSKQEEAERLAHLIESQTSDNIHIRQERGQALEEGGGDGDEEALWSGVIGTGGLAKSSVHLESAWKRGANLTAPSTNSALKAAPSAQVKGGSINITKTEKPKKDDKPNNSPPATWAARAANSVKDKTADVPKSSATSLPMPAAVSSVPTAESTEQTVPVPSSTNISQSLTSSPDIATKPAEQVIPSSDTSSAAAKATGLKATAKEYVFVPRATAKEYTPSVTAVTRAITGNIGAAPPAVSAQPVPAMPAGFPQAPIMLMPGYEGNYPQAAMSGMVPPFMQMPAGDNMPMVVMQGGMMPMYPYADQQFMMQGPPQGYGFQGQGGGYYNNGYYEGGGRGRGGGRGGRGPYNKRDYEQRNSANNSEAFGSST